MDIFKKVGFMNRLKMMGLFFLRELGSSSVWVAIMAALVILEIFLGFSFVRMVWIIACLFCFFLSRIALAVESIANAEK